VAFLGLIQLVPYGRDRTPQPAIRPFQWRDPGAAALARSACYDCHSGETRWWWAVKVAPFSWLAQQDVDRGRRHLDFSNWNGRLTPERLDRALRRGMPPAYYTIAHPEARLDEAQKQTLVAGFRASLPGNAALAPSGPWWLVRVSNTDPESDRILEESCSSCHSASRAADFHTSNPAKAQALIDKMVRRGARISPAGEEILIRRFTR
jgi:hypothetical protein